MADDQKPNPLLPLSGVFLILAALGVTVLTPPFKGSRPTVPDIPETYEKVNARLWEDPFQAVLSRAPKKVSTNVGSNITEPNQEGAGTLLLCDENKQNVNKQKNMRALELEGLQKEIQKRKEKEKITILGVMVPGQP